MFTVSRRKLAALVCTAAAAATVFTVADAPAASAAGTCAAPGWSADYFANETMTGTPVLSRCDAAVNFSWGAGSPDAALPVNHFSARWTQTQTLTGGSYRVSTTADDGVTVLIDGVSVIADWHNQNATTTNAMVQLAPGAHTIVMQYFEGTGSATAQLTFVNVVSDAPSLTTQTGDDEFNAAALDPNTWTVYNSGAANPANDPTKVAETGGALALKTKGLSGSGVCMCTTSSKPTTPYGRWDFRAKMSAGYANGGVIMLWPNAENWPVGGELDLAELSTATRQSADYVVHYGTDNRQILLTTPLDATAWHTYSVEWTASKIRYWIDGLLVSTITDPAVIPTGAMHLVAQTGPHTQATANTAASELDIDWIHTYN